MINRLLRNLKLIKQKNLPFDEALYNRKKKLAKKIYKIFSGKIQYGRYASTKIDWSNDIYCQSLHISSRLLGLYEEQVQDKIIKLKKNTN